jgi:uncharacterized protein
MEIAIVIYLLIGVIAGFMAGLFGIGGGMIIVPGLAYLLPADGVANAQVMHVAAGTSLASIILTLLVAAITHLKNKTIIWAAFRNLLPGIVIGAIVGASITSHLPTFALKILFGVFMIALGIYMVCKKEQTATTDFSPKIWQWLSAGLFIGCMSSLLGVGGGAFAVPILLRFGVPIHKATATSVVCALAPSIIGAICFMIAGAHVTGLPRGSVGYVYWPAAIGIAVVGFAFVPLGAKLAQRLSSILLKRIFAVYLVLVGIDMFIH